MKCMIGCGKFAGFRGGTEHCNLSPVHVAVGMYPHNCECQELAGLHYIEIETFCNHKTNKLTITTGYVKEMAGRLRFTINRQDKGCFGACMERFMAKLAPGQTRFYCYPIPPTNKTAAGAFEGQIFYRNKPLGVNTVRRLMKEGAKKLGIKANFLPHSLRALCITKLVNNKAVSTAEMMKVARHNSVAASVTYQEVDAVSEHNRMLALGVPLPLLKNQEDEEKKPSVCDREVLEDCSASTHTTSFQDDDDDGSMEFVYEESSCEEEEEEEKVVLQGRSAHKRVKIEATKTSKKIPDVSMTQVGIENLKHEIDDLEELMRPKVVKKKISRLPRPLSDNQRQIQELRGVVSKLKRKLEDSRHDKLYFESVIDDHVRENEGLKGRLRAATSFAREKDEYSDHSDWVLNKGYTRDRERTDGRRRFY